jgi:hypothetical protein
MRKKLVFLKVALALMLLFSVSLVGAQPQEPYPLGEINLTATQVAAGIGWTWGSGTLKFKDKIYAFTVQGLNVSALGISKISAKGDVYNLTSPSDLEGNYVTAGAGLAVIKGAAGLVMRNAKGVVINLISDQTGVQLSLGTDGLAISMK